VQAQVLKGASEDIRIYELLFDADAKESGTGKWGIHRTLIITDQRVFLCHEDHQKWASESNSPLFTVISAEKRSEFASIVSQNTFPSQKAHWFTQESKEFRYSGKFSISFGVKRGFASVDSKRKWTF
jgi:hypothetical protein